MLKVPSTFQDLQNIMLNSTRNTHNKISGETDYETLKTDLKKKVETMTQQLVYMQKMLKIILSLLMILEEKFECNIKNSPVTITTELLEIKKDYMLISKKVKNILLSLQQQRRNKNDSHSDTDVNLFFIYIEEFIYDLQKIKSKLPFMFDMLLSSKENPEQPEKKCCSRKVPHFHGILNNIPVVIKLSQDIKNEKETSETLFEQLQLCNLKIEHSLSTMVIPSASADVNSKLLPKCCKKSSSSDIYPSSVSSENALFSKNTSNINNGGGEKVRMLSSKHFVNSTVKQEITKKISSKRCIKSKTLQWACSNDFPYIPSIQSLPRSTADMKQIDNPDLHVLYHRNNRKGSAQSSFCESNMKMTNEQREFQKHTENNF